MGLAENWVFLIDVKYPYSGINTFHNQGQNGGRVGPEGGASSGKHPLLCPAYLLRTGGRSCKKYFRDLNRLAQH